MFKLHKKLLKTTHSVADLNLCTARLMDNAKFPWLILIPKRKNIRQILDLNKKDQIKLMQEIDYCSKVMKKAFKAFNLNVEKIGNIIPQLHIHIIARNKKDSSWPLSVWVVKGKPYKKSHLSETIKKIQKLI
ncbi:Hit Diadenosine tetraphosphate (Ap4A) hydrolase and other HIT family hydrolases [Candidatus Pelagibacterales bacterium]|jgi:diadenosine tetraphosphate (Ap4A) HIT family hydrolase